MNTTTTATTTAPDTAVTTANYHLSQWDAGDRILRDNFNADNAKIDAAIKAEETARKAAITAETNARSSADSSLRGSLATAGASELIRSGTANGNVAIISPNTSSVDWSRYSLVLFHIANCEFSSGFFRCNGGGTSQSPGSGSWGNNFLYVVTNEKGFSAILPVNRSAASRMTLLGIGNSLQMGRVDLPLSQCTSFSFEGGGNLNAGVSFSMWGVR